MQHEPEPGPHGGDAVAVARWLGVAPQNVLDLSASLNPVAPDPVPLVIAAAERIRHYPNTDVATDRLAAAIGVPTDRLVVTNGGAEAIALVAGLHAEGWVEQPEFSLYERHLERLRPDAPRWRSNPSNPLGRLAPPDDQAAVWDEAFYPLATGEWTRGDDASWRLGSLTKLWACPGLRLGYLIAPSAVDAAAVRARQARWSVNALALALVEAMIEATNLPEWSAVIAARRASLADALRSRSLTVRDTDACWILVERAGLREALLPQGVVVRDCANFGLAGTYRISVPNDEGLERLLGAIDATVP